MAYNNKSYIKNSVDSLLSYRNLKNRINSNNIPSLLVLSGDEHFLLENCYIDICESLLSDDNHLINKLIYDFDNKNIDFKWDDLSQEIFTPSLFGFGSRRIFVIKNSGLFSSTSTSSLSTHEQTIIKGLFDELVGSEDASCLIFIERKIDRRSKLLKDIISHDLLFTFPKLSSSELERWIKDRAKELELNLSPDLVLYLIEACDSSLSLIEQELKKIKLALNSMHFDANEVQRSSHILNVKSVEKILRPNLTGDVFSLVDAISNSDMPTVLKIYNNLLDRKEPTQMILIMLQRHFRELLCILDSNGLNDEEILKILAYGSNMSWKIRKLRNQARNFSRPKLIYLINLARDIDKKIKSNGYFEANEMLILLSLAGSRN